jgi:hypothetical protein
MGIFMRRLLIVSLAVILCCTVATYAASGGNKKNSTAEFKPLTGVNILWDRAQGFPSRSSNSPFCDLAEELINLGAEVKDLKPGWEYSDDMLEGVDLVIIVLRYLTMYAWEQEALVRYVQNGGGLLILCKYGETLYACNPVLTNFGVTVSNQIIKTREINVFIHPATTEQIPVHRCELVEPRKIFLSASAKAIAGNTPKGNSGEMDNCVFAIGGNSGKGRMIAGSCTNQWLSRMYVCGPNKWGKADNTKLLHNVLMYLAGYSDLKAQKIRVRRRIVFGKNIKLRCVVRNLEVNNSKAIPLGFYLSDNDTLDDKDRFLGEAEVPEIKGNGKAKVKISQAIPDTIDPGNYYILAVIDPEGIGKEFNSENNVISKGVTLGY